RDASAFRGLIYPFQQAVKRYSGEKYKNFRRHALDFYKRQIEPDKAKAATPSKTVTNYYFPQYINSDSLLYLKWSYRQIPAFYIRDKKGEHKIKQRNISSEEWFSYRDGLLAYTAYSVQPRRSLVDYSDIILLDIQTKEEKKLTHKGKYFTPDISPSGKSLIAVSIDDSLQTELHVLNRADGKLIRKIKAKSDAYFLHPKFISEQTIVLAIRTMDGRMSLNTMDLETEKTGELIAPSVNTLGNPFVSDGKVYFTASYAGNDDVYVFDLTEKKLYQLTSGQTGNYYAAAYRDSLTWSQFTARGLQIKSASLKSLDKRAFATTGLKQVVPYPVAGSEPNLLATPNKRFSVKRYNQTYRFFNFHSWNPDYTDPEFSITVSSNNILNTFANELSYIYNRAEQSHTVGFNALYGGFFPVLSAGIDYTFNRHINRGNIEYLFHQRELRLGYSIPLNFSQGKTFKLLNFGSNFVFNQLQPTGAFKDSMR
ncbi:MAG: hypothetical protein ICV84_05925, partial [Flavisolibacter sp.]|nr:hypothetical protein [Flavisolibacter sp.]